MTANNIRPWFKIRPSTLPGTSLIRPLSTSVQRTLRRYVLQGCVQAHPGWLSTLKVPYLRHNDINRQLRPTVPAHTSQRWSAPCCTASAQASNHALQHDTLKTLQLLQALVPCRLSAINSAPCLPPSSSNIPTLCKTYVRRSIDHPQITKH